MKRSRPTSCGIVADNFDHDEGNTGCSDNVDDADGATLRVYRRDSGGEDWTTDDYAATDVYKTPLLPEFELPVRPDTE